jgi:zinc transport system substrate-binding protein
MTGRRLLQALAALAALVASACAAPGAGAGPGFEVVAAVAPIAEAARRIGGDAVRVHDLTPPGVEPHDLELRPGDVARMRSAGLVLYLSGGFQPAIEDVVRSLPDRSRAVDLLEGLPLRRAAEEGEEGAIDPHVWLDPVLFARVARRIATELEARLPAERDALARRAAAYVGAIEDLHATFERTLASCRRRELVTVHAAFGYLAARYGLEQVAITGVAPDAEPTPRRLEEVARLVRERGVTTVFYERAAGPRVAEAIAAATGVRTAALDPLERPPAGGDYLSVMRANLRALAEGLGCPPPS